jgi:hypothetical protein
MEPCGNFFLSDKENLNLEEIRINAISGFQQGIRHEDENVRPNVTRITRKASISLFWYSLLIFEYGKKML